MCGRCFFDVHIQRDIATKVLQVNTKTIERLRQRFVEGGFDACIERKAYPDIKQSKVDGEFEAHLIAISCSKAPEGFTRWSLRMLAELPSSCT